MLEALNINMQLAALIALASAITALSTCVWYERRTRLRTERQLADARQELQQQSHHDQLTALPNRMFLLEVLPERLKSTAPFALLYLKFPRAAQMRGSLGHEMTDELTQALVKRLLEVMSNDHFLARLSASAFAMVVPAQSLSMAQEAAQQLQTILAKPYMLNNQEVQMISLIGVRHSQDGDDAANLLRDAEIAMQSVQQRQTDSIALFEPPMRAKLEARHELETDLRRAIYFETNQLNVAFQPIMQLAEQKLIGFEALARWQHPVKGFIPPDQFIGIAEATGMIVPLWNSILNEACRRLIEWQSYLPQQELFVSVNLSASQFFTPGLVRSVAHALEVNGLSGRQLKIEITESGLMQDIALTSPQLEQLRSLGCSLSIDDFGTGYSSLSYLLKLPVDDIKIDRSFIQVMHQAPENRALVRTVIDLGRLLQKRVIAEGIETIEDLRLLQEMGCACGQGYYFCKPLLPAQMRDYLQKLRETKKLAVAHG